MIEAILSALKTFISGFAALTIPNIVLIGVGCLLIFLAIKKGYEPLLLLPIGFGALLANLPLTGLTSEGGLLYFFYQTGIVTEIFPCLIFIGIGAMTDFGPLLANPKILLLGAAGQCGIFLTLGIALAIASLPFINFSQLDSVAVSIIGACDGPTSIFVASKYAPKMLGAVSVAAYSYMALVPLIQPPIMRALTTRKERVIKMEYPEKTVSKSAKILFPIIVTIVTCLIAPMGAPLMGMIMLGNLLKESGVVDRLTKSAENEITNVVTLLLGITIGSTMKGENFFQVRTAIVFVLGFIAICLDTVVGVLFGKLMCHLSKRKINPLIGAAGISAYPMAARVVQNEGRKYDTNNWLLMHSMGANTGGQIGSIMAAAIMISVIQGLGIV
ncbi:MAG: sodium ion-translocating decarboxylase subunit beta [Spirochaetales bacterium]|nr:sodium ion-translocating decarboxylase subunit beta [Spirochaetales bacterium]